MPVFALRGAQAAPHAEADGAGHVRHDEAHPQQVHALDKGTHGERVDEIFAREAEDGHGIAPAVSHHVRVAQFGLHHALSDRHIERGEVAAVEIV